MPHPRNADARPAADPRRIATALLAAGDRTGARRALEAALGAADPGDGPALAALHADLGAIARSAGEVDEAIRRYGCALAVLQTGDGNRAAERRLLHVLAALEHARGELATGEAHARGALALREAGAADHGREASADRVLLGSLIAEQGRHEEGAALLGRAAADLAAALGDDHVEVARVKTALGDALHRSGRLEEARAAFQAALAARESSLGREHPEHAPTLLELSRIAQELGDRDAALAWAGRAVASLEGRVPADHPVLREGRALAARPP